MKKVITVFTLCAFIFSCSDKLTNSHAEDIVAACLKTDPQYGKVDFNTGEIRFYTNKEQQVKRLGIYENLAEVGVITMDSLKSSKRYNHTTYLVSFTDKAKEFVLESETKSIFRNDKNKAIVKTFDYEVGEVKEVHEIPSMNAADVTVIYEKKNKTPFFGLSRDEADFITKKVAFRKTSDDGWRFCD